jgi:hypothetical protein
MIYLANERRAMTNKIQQLLRELFDTNPSNYLQPGHVVERDGDNYKLFVSGTMGGFSDIVNAHKALEHAGLVDNSRDPEVGEYGITTKDNHITLGSADAGGNFIDKAALSDNANGTAQPNIGFGFEISFAGKSESVVEQKLGQAISFLAAERDRTILKKAAEERAKVAAAKKEHQIEALAAQLQEEVGRTDSIDEKAVVNYAKTQLEKAMPGIQVTITPPEDDQVFDIVYGIKTKSRRLRIELPADEETRLSGISFDDPGGKSDLMNKLAAALREKLTLTRSDFADISGSEPGGILTGTLAGTSAKLSAEIRGALQQEVSLSKMDGGSWTDIIGKSTGRQIG